jgi:hypothetical protein
MNIYIILSQNGKGEIIMSILTGEDSIMDIPKKMSDGNVGALMILMGILTETPKIDPQDMFEGLGPIMQLDEMGIHGTDIYTLGSKQCNGDIRELIMLLRANQMGFIGADKLRKIAADELGRVRLSQEEMDKLNEKVCERLEQFQPRTIPAAFE